MIYSLALMVLRGQLYLMWHAKHSLHLNSRATQFGDWPQITVLRYLWTHFTHISLVNTSNVFYQSVV